MKVQEDAGFLILSHSTVQKNENNIFGNSQTLISFCPDIHIMNEVKVKWKSEVSAWLENYTSDYGACNMLLKLS